MDRGNITTPDAADLDTAARKYAASQGWAMTDGSYPIRPADMHGRADLQKAIHAVGRGGASHNAIRVHVIRRAKTLGMSDLIPDNWNSDGSLRSTEMADLERRFTPGAEGKLDLRQQDGRKRIGGYAAVFNRSSKNLGGFTEIVDPVAFNQSRGDNWPGVLCRYNHTELIGTTSAGTLQLRTDTYGLAYDVEPPASRGYVLELVDRGDVTKSSFAFRTIDDDWTYVDGMPRRTLMRVHLVDVAPVDDPAYADTSVGMRNAPASVEAALRSLALKKSVDFEEVRSAAEIGELRKFFVRTDDTGKPVPPAAKTYGPAARMAILGREKDPWS